MLMGIGNWPAALALASLAACVAAAPAAIAQTPEGQNTLVPPVRLFTMPIRLGILAEAPIALQQAIGMALANNKDIEASRIDLDEAELSLMGARGAFDPVFNNVGFWEKQITPVASSLAGSATGALLSRIWQTDPTLSGSTPWLGGSYKVDFSSQQTFTNNTFVTLNPQYPTALNLQYTQPLWRGLRYDSNRHAIDVARKNQALSGEQFRQRVMSVVANTEQAYWELVYAFNNLGVQLEAVEIGRQQDESNRRQEAQGLLAPIDVVAAQTQLANFELGAYAAQAALTSAENTLKALILPDRTTTLWYSALVPATPENTLPAESFEEAVMAALANRPELAEVGISAEINQQDTRYFRDLTHPQIDLTASYSRAGLAGPQVPAGPNPLLAGFGPLLDRVNALSAVAGLAPISLGATGSTPPGLVGNYGQSLSNLWAGNFPSTEVQLRISVPIRNRTAEANLGHSLAEERRIRNQRQQIEQTIESDVRNALQNLQTAQARLDAAVTARQSAEEQYQSEQRQFRTGTSTLFLVQQRQTSMIAARSQERRADADLGEAIASWELATGSILSRHSINLQPVRANR